MDMCHEEGFKGKILIADDEPGIIRLIRDFLKYRDTRSSRRPMGLKRWKSFPQNRI